MSNYTRGTGHRDDNESIILDVAHVNGYLDWERIAQDDTLIQHCYGWYQKRGKRAGHDVLFCDARGFFIVEVKNLEGRTKTGELEPREKTMFKLCEWFNVPHYKVCNPEEMQAVLNERR